MTITAFPWLRDFLVRFLKQEPDEVVRKMGERFERQFAGDQWRTGASFYVLDFYDSEIEALTACDGFQRIYDHMKQVRKEGRNVVGRMWEYNYITQRMQEFCKLVYKLTNGNVIIHTKKQKVHPVVPATEAPAPSVVLFKDEVQCPKSCHSATFAKHKEDAQRVLDELQACLVLSGGSKASIQNLANMTLAEMLFVCLPNNISVKVSLTSLPRTTPLLT